MLTGIHYNVPAIDGDFMGRAYPRLYLLTPYRQRALPLSPLLTMLTAFTVYGIEPTPCTQSDGMGNVVTVNKCRDIRKLEKIHRKAGQEIGLFSQMVIPPMTVKQTKHVGTLGTTSLAWYIGRAVYLARQQNTSIMKAIVSVHVCEASHQTLTMLHRSKLIPPAASCTPARSSTCTATSLLAATQKVAYASSLLEKTSKSTVTMSVPKHGRWCCPSRTSISMPSSWRLVRRRSLAGREERSCAQCRI